MQAVVTVRRDKTVLHKSTLSKNQLYFWQTLEMFVLYVATIRCIAACLFIYLFMRILKCDIYSFTTTFYFM